MIEAKESDLFKLNKKQQLAFNRLKKSYADLIKAGCGVYNNYGHIGFFDGNKIRHYDDTSTIGSIYDSGQNSHNEIKSVDSWADDAHYFHPKHSSSSY